MTSMILHSARASLSPISPHFFGRHDKIDFSFFVSQPKKFALNFSAIIIE